MMTEREKNPMQAAQQAMRPPLPRRFYKHATAHARGGLYHVELDGKPARTPAKRLLALPTRALGEAVAREWAAAGETIDPTRMPLTRLANVAIDRVADHTGEVIDEVVKYAGSDLVCYRAGEPEGLVVQQGKHWTPVLDWAQAKLGARFRLCQGVRFIEQDRTVLDAFRAEVEKTARPFGLAALASATQLTGSALISLGLALGALDAEAAWSAAHVDEDWQISQWGEDAEARQRREFRRAEFDAATAMLRLG